MYSVIVNFICNQIVAHFCIAKTGHLRCYLYTFLCADRRPSAHAAHEDGSWWHKPKHVLVVVLKTRAAETHATKFRARATTLRTDRNTPHVDHLAFSLTLSDFVDTLWFGGIQTDSLSQHQVQDSHSNTDITHRFCCHGCTSFQRHNNFTECDPLVPVHAFVFCVAFFQQ